MAGPINGGARGINGVLVPSVLQMSSDILRYFTGITCLYNRYWYQEVRRVTLPICLFHVTKITEQWQNEVSAKRVILYEPQGVKEDKDMVDPLREGIMQSIVDNIVRKPKSYSMEIIVPFQPLGRYITRETTNAYMVLQELMRDGTGEVGSIFSEAMKVFHHATQAVQMLGRLPGLNDISFINKNSLEAMVESGKILTMKMWTGYAYKYVTITNLSLDKQGTEDDVFRGTMTLQEMPILTMTKPSEYKAAKYDPLMNRVTKIAKTLSAPVIKLTGVDSNSFEGTTEAAAQEASATAQGVGA